LVAIKKSAAIAAEESFSGKLNWTFAPMVDVARDALGSCHGRALVNPFLGSKIAVARVQGFQVRIAYQYHSSMC
jgi:beta-glucosidase